MIENVRDPSKREGIYVRREPPTREGVQERSRSRERDREREGLGGKDGRNANELVRENRHKNGAGAEREVRKGFRPPTTSMHGPKNPTCHPKSILKKVEANQLGQVDGISISLSSL